MLVGTMATCSVMLMYTMVLAALVLACSGMMHWASMSLGRSRIHTGAHTASTGVSNVLYACTPALVLSSMPSSVYWGVACTYVM